MSDGILHIFYTNPCMGYPIVTKHDENKRMPFERKILKPKVSMLKCQRIRWAEPVWITEGQIIRQSMKWKSNKLQLRIAGQQWDEASII